MPLQMTVKLIAQNAKSASHQLSTLAASTRQKAIAAMPEKLQAVKDELFAVNAQDVQAARSAGLDEPLVKRLEISDTVFQYMLSRLHKVAALPDPLDRVL